MIYIPRELHFARDMKKEFNYGKQTEGRVSLSAGHFQKEKKKELYNYAKQEPLWLLARRKIQHMYYGFLR